MNGDPLEFLMLAFPLAHIILMAIALADLVKRKRAGSMNKWVWAVIVVVVHIAGPIIYLVFGRGEK